jgi:hypothetical protein
MTTGTGSWRSTATPAEPDANGRVHLRRDQPAYRQGLRPWSPGSRSTRRTPGRTPMAPGASSLATCSARLDEICHRPGGSLWYLTDDPGTVRDPPIRRGLQPRRVRHLRPDSESVDPRWEIASCSRDVNGTGRSALPLLARYYADLSGLWRRTRWAPARRVQSYRYEEQPAPVHDPTARSTRQLLGHVAAGDGADSALMEEDRVGVCLIICASRRTP